MEFRKSNILRFPTHGHPWDRLVSDLHETLLPTAFPITTENFVEFEEKRRKLSSAKGVTPMVIFKYNDSYQSLSNICFDISNYFNYFSIASQVRNSVSIQSQITICPVAHQSNWWINNRVTGYELV